MKLWFHQLASEVAECKDVAKPDVVGMYFDKPILLPEFLASNEKKNLAKLVAAVDNVQ